MYLKINCLSEKAREYRKLLVQTKQAFNMSSVQKVWTAARKAVSESSLPSVEEVEDDDVIEKRETSTTFSATNSTLQRDAAVSSVASTLTVTDEGDMAIKVTATASTSSTSSKATTIQNRDDTDDQPSRSFLDIDEEDDWSDKEVDDKILRLVQEDLSNENTDRDEVNTITSEQKAKVYIQIHSLVV